MSMSVPARAKVLDSNFFKVYMDTLSRLGAFLQVQWRFSMYSRENPRTIAKIHVYLEENAISYARLTKQASPTPPVLQVYVDRRRASSKYTWRSSRYTWHALLLPALVLKKSASADSTTLQVYLGELQVYSDATPPPSRHVQVYVACQVRGRQVYVGGAL